MAMENSGYIWEIYGRLNLEELVICRNEEQQGMKHGATASRARQPWA